MADHTFAGEAPFLHFVVLHAEFVLGESQGAARSPLRGDPGGLWPPSAALRAAGAAPFPPRRPAKDPVSCLGRPLQTAGFSPQGSRPADGFGGRWPPTAPRSGAGPAGGLLPASHGIRQQTARLRRAGGRNPPKSSFGRFGLRPPFPSQKSQKGAPPTGKGAPFLFIRLTATFSGGNTVPTAPPPLPPLR